MTSEHIAPRASRRATVAGWIVGAVPVLMLLFSAAMKFARPPSVVQGFTHLGYGENLAPGLGIIEIACTVAYLLPRTRVIGAILITGYLGGAAAAHVRLGEMDAAMPVLLGVLAWLGLYLRDPRLRVLVPLTS